MMQQQFDMYRGPSIKEDKNLQEYQARGELDDNELVKLFTHGNWPENEMFEMISGQPGINEIQLLIPLMKSAIKNNKKILWVSPPYFSFAPYLVSSGVDISKLNVVQSDCSCNEVIRSVEKAVQDDEHAIIFAWLDWLPNSVVKRIQEATRSSKADSRKLTVLFRQHEQRNSPGRIKLKISHSVEGIRISFSDRPKIHTQQLIH